jgi:hypothetical protein
MFALKKEVDEAKRGGFAEIRDQRRDHQRAG